MFWGLPISLKYCLANFSDASTASDPLDTKYTLFNPLGELCDKMLANSSAGSLVKKDV